MPLPPPIALTIAGSDCSAGAGIQADLKTFMAHGVYGLTALTCVVAEVPGRVSRVQAMTPGLIEEQIALCLQAFPIGAMKTGLLHSREVIEAVARQCAGTGLPLVVDPVMVATSGTSLLEPTAVKVYQQALFPLATLVTPNLDEARVLLGHNSKITDVAAMRSAGVELVQRHGCAFLMKGGHLSGAEAVDLLCLPNGDVAEYRAEFTRKVSTHGTGCTYSAATTAGLARGRALPDAVADAKRYITSAVARSFRWEVDGRRVEALNHQSGVENRAG